MDSKHVLGQMRLAIRALGYSRRTESIYVGWARRYMSFHDDLNPAQLDTGHAAAFLSQLTGVHAGCVAILNQAATALRFLHRHVLNDGRPVPRAPERAREAALPVVLTQSEVKRLLDELPVEQRILISVMYGCGLRPREALRLRFRDIDLERGRVVVRGPRGHVREVPVPRSIIDALERQLGRIRALHSRDRSQGAGWVTLSGIAARHYPRGLRALEWQYIFPATLAHSDPLSQKRCRHHLHESTVQRAVRRAARRAGIRKPVTCYVFRHSLAAELLKRGYDIGTVAELMGLRSLRSVRLYYRVVDPGDCIVPSPLDTL